MACGWMQVIEAGQRLAPWEGLAGPGLAELCLAVLWSVQKGNTSRGPWSTELSGERDWLQSWGGWEGGGGGARCLPCDLKNIDASGKGSGMCKGPGAGRGESEDQGHSQSTGVGWRRGGVATTVFY